MNHQSIYNYIINFFKSPIHINNSSEPSGKPDSNGTILITSGYCAICGTETTFSSKHKWLRDNFICDRCGTCPRQRAIVEVLSMVAPRWRELTIHESSPCIWYFAQQCSGYTASFFHENEPLGAYKDNYRNENIEQLTFEDNTFDIFLTQDVLEHVFEPGKALAEIMRVVKPGGMHVFTAPKNKKILISQRRASLIDGSIHHLKEAEYHGNPINSDGSLVTWDFGADFDDLIQDWSGYNTSNFIIRDRRRGIDAEYLDVFVTIKDHRNRIPIEWVI